MPRMIPTDEHPESGHPGSCSTPLIAGQHANDGKQHLLLAASGSVATIKLPNIVHELGKYSNLSIRIILTKSAGNFLAGQSPEQPLLDTLLTYPNVDGIYHDEDEWNRPWIRTGGILHIELRRWADILIIAPLSANSMAKMTTGLADNLLLSVIRAWDTTGEFDASIENDMRKLIVVAPAMNVAMWKHPITKKQIDVLEKQWGVNGDPEGWVEVLRPIEKTLACGDVGDGAMHDWRDIVKVIEARLRLTNAHGENVWLSPVVQEV